MVNYIESLKSDIVEQFKGKPFIGALLEVVGKELQEVYDFYEQLKTQRNLYTSVGKQLDGVGDIVVMTRKEAGQLAGNPIPFDVIDDETYRQYLIYKVLKNTCDCTYPDIIKAFRMFWDKPLYYTESLDEPATMIFDTGEMQGLVDTTPLFRTPLIRAAGVTLKIIARTSTEMPTDQIKLLSGLGYAVTITCLPVIEREYNFDSEIRLGTDFGTVSEDTLPAVERNYRLDAHVKIGSHIGTESSDSIPSVELDYRFRSPVGVNSGFSSITHDVIPALESGRASARDGPFEDVPDADVMETPIEGVVELP